MKLEFRNILVPIFALLWSFSTQQALGHEDSHDSDSGPVPNAIEVSEDYPHPHVPGEVLVKFKAGSTAQDVMELEEKAHLHLVEKIRVRKTEICHFRVKEHGHSLRDCIEECLFDPNVEYAEPNYIVEASVIPNDASFGTLWGLHNTGQSGGKVDADIDAPEAWDVTTGSSAIVVAVIDTGVDWGHPDLAANMWKNPGEVAGNGLDDDANGLIDDVYGYDYVNNDGDPMDDNSHGTHVAGTIAAVGNNGAGVVGVTWNARIMALKFLAASGSGSVSNAIKCVQYAVAKGAKIMNNSWGGGGYSQAMADAITAANNAGMLFVAAAGNANSNNDSSSFYPANYTHANVISVASTDRNDNRSSFSNYGATTVDLGAPGSSILSTVPGGGYGTKSGTSMATPHVSGAAALVWGQNPTLTHLQVRDRLYAAVDVISALSGITVTGGRLNVNSALDKETTPPAPIADLAAVSSDLFSVALRWTATGDDGNVGTASRYEIRYSTSLIDANNFNQATLVSNSPAPKAAGSVENFTVPNLLPSTSYYFAIKVFDNAGNSSAISNVVARSTADGFLVFQDDVESGINGWTVSGSDGAGGPALWHISSNRSVSPTRSWYYGKEGSFNYDTGAINAGTLTSKPISLAGLSDATLVLTHFLTTENSSSYDIAKVEISSNGGATFQTLLTKTTTNNKFVMESVNLNSYVGSVVLFRFSFNTVDAVANSYEGWYVDDIKVWSTTPDTTAPAAVADLAGKVVTLPPSGGQKLNAKAIESSGDMSGEYSYANLTDGNVGTFWSSSGTSSPQKHFVLDLGSTQLIEKLRMIPRTDNYNLFFPVDFKIQVSADKVNWTTAHTVTGYQAQPNVWGEWTFASVSGRYVRVQVDKLGGIYPYNSLYYCQISEAEVYEKAGSTGGQAIELSWTSVGDDGNTGAASSYDNRYSTAPIDASNFANATQLSGEPAPKASGAAETYNAVGLGAGKYYFAMKVIDEAGNASLLSNVAYVSTVDEVAPAAVTNLAANVVSAPVGSGQKIAATAIESSGDMSGEYGYKNLSDGNTSSFWSSSGSGSPQKHFVLDLGSSKSIGKFRMLPRSENINLFSPVDFKIQVSADKMNWTTAHSVTGYQAQPNVWGEWSFTSVNGRYVKVVVEKLGGPYPYNSLYYCQILETELYEPGTGTSGDSVELSWTAVGDDGSTGTAASYDIRYSTAPIDAANFAAATQLNGEPTPKAVGAAETHPVAGLPPGKYYFAMKVADEAGNLSGLSNVVFASTSGDETAPAAVTTLAATVVDLPSGSGQKLGAKAIESSGDLSSEYNFGNLTDGNSSTFWSSSGSGSPQKSFVLDLGSAQTIEKLKMLPRPENINWFAPVDFKIQVSADKVSWTTAHTVTGYQAQAGVWGEWTFTAVSARFVRLTVDKLGGAYPYNGLYYCQILEVEVYEQGSGGGTQAIQLNWTAVGDDGNTGTATTYDIRYSTAAIDANNFASATQLNGEPIPKAAGTAEAFQVATLNPGKYYFAMKVADEAGNLSGLSNGVFASTSGDETAPAAVTTLAAKIVNLPGGGGQKLAAKAVESSGDLSGEYSYANLTDGSTATFWSSPGTSSQQRHFVLDLGSTQTIEKIRMLPRDYYPNLFFPVDFKIQVSSDKMNWTTAQTVTGYTAQTNVWGEWTFTAVSARYVRVWVDKLGGPYPYNGLYYCQIFEAEVYEKSTQSGGEAVQLDWTAVGDDGNTGTATTYDIRYSTAPIDATNFAGATAITGEPAPKVAGSAETHQITGLPAGTYYFAMKVADEAGNVSSLSNVATVTKTSSTGASESSSSSGSLNRVSDLHVESSGSTSALLAWSAAAGQSVKHFDLRYSTKEITESTFSALPSLPLIPKEGTIQNGLVSGLAPDTVYYFALKYATPEGAMSPLSNLAQTATQLAGAANPEDPGNELATEESLVFVKQPAVAYPTTLQGLLDALYHFDYATLFPAGANLHRLASVSSAGEVTPLTQFSGASLRDPHASADGKKLLFAMRDASTPKWQVYEVFSDGTGLEKVSGDTTYNDVEPFYLPDGRIGFVSDRLRAPEVALTQVNLFAMNADGSGVELLTTEATHTDFAPRLDAQGQLTFSRLKADVVAEADAVEVSETETVETPAPLKITLFKLDPASKTETEAYSFDANVGSDSGYVGVAFVPKQSVVSYFGSSFAGSTANFAGLPFDVSPLEPPLNYSETAQMTYLGAVFAGGQQLAVARAALVPSDPSILSVPADFDLMLFDVATQQSTALHADPKTWDWMPVLLKMPVEE